MDKIVKNKSLLDHAKDVFKDVKKSMTLQELWKKVAERAGLSENDKKIVDFYSQLTRDGSFFFDKEKKEWSLIFLEKVDEVKKNKTDVDKLEAEDNSGEEGEIYVEDDEEDFDDASSKELKKNTFDDPDNENIKQDVIEEN